MNKTELENIIKNSEYNYYGLRMDEYKYNVGDECFKSHQLYQDAFYDDNDDFVYPLITEGINKGFFDAGELNGTCCLMITIDNIDKVLNNISDYYGDYCNLIAGNMVEDGNDMGEIIIENAVVLASFDI